VWDNLWEVDWGWTVTGEVSPIVGGHSSHCLWFGGRKEGGVGGLVAGGLILRRRTQRKVKARARRDNEAEGSRVLVRLAPLDVPV
jgi:hypothetical protein